MAFSPGSIPNSTVIFIGMTVERTTFAAGAKKRRRANPQVDAPRM